MYRLVFLSGRYAGKRLVVRQAATLVGRDPDCHLILADDPLLAPKHARFEDRGTGIYLTALDPAHAVLRNGEPVREAIRLAHNDLLELGQTRIQFQNIIAPHQRAQPSPGLLQPVTLLLAGLILVTELALVAYVTDWRHHIIQPAIEAADLARAEELRAVQAAGQGPNAGTPAPPASVMELPGTTPAAPAETATNGAAAGDAPANPLAAPPPPPEVVQALQDADFPPASPETPMEILPPVSAADPQIEEAQRLLAAAVSAADFADYAQAFRILNQIHQDAHGFLPAHVEHARLLEARGDLDAARERWILVLGLAPENSSFHPQALEARERLDRLQALQTQVLQTSETPPASALPHDVRIVAPDIQKMPSDVDIAEMRVLKATLELAPDAKLFKDAAIQVFVTFYDADTNNQAQATRAITTPSPIVLGNVLADRRSTAIEATYVVPRGLRAQVAKETGRPMTYYGYTLHVFAGRMLQDAAAKPRKLLDLPIRFPVPATDEAASGSAPEP